MKVKWIKKIVSKIFLVYIMMLFILSFDIFAQAPKLLMDLKKIQPLVNNQQDVENIVGKKGKAYPIKDDWYYFLVEYKTKFGYWNVKYSTGKCSEKKREGYDVAKGIVLEAHLVLEKFINFSTLKLDLDKFEKYQESDTNNLSYTDYESGISYTKGGVDVLNSINVFPSRKYENLACSNKTLDNKSDIVKSYFKDF